MNEDYEFMKKRIVETMDTYKGVPERMKLDIINILNIYKRALNNNKLEKNERINNS